MTVALVVVSHSSLLARGVQEVTGLLAPNVRVVAAGGVESGELGTSFDLVRDALTEASNPDGVAVLADIGSAVVAAQSAVRDRIGALALARLAQAPLVEGAVAAAVAAQGGADLDAVVTIAERVKWGKEYRTSITPDRYQPIARRLSLRRGQRMHARHAANLALLVSGFDATVTVNGVDATSVLDLVDLGLAPGARMDIEATGADADAVIESMAIVIADGFGADL